MNKPFASTTSNLSIFIVIYSENATGEGIALMTKNAPYLHHTKS